MRIISKFKDYYDSAQAYGTDQSTVFQRTTENIEIVRRDRADHVPAKYSLLHSMLNGVAPYPHTYAGSSIHACAIAFCGVLWPFATVIAPNGEQHIYDHETLIPIITKFEGESMYRYGFNQKWTAFFALRGDTRLKQWTIEQRIPIVMWQNCRTTTHNGLITVNPNLSNIEFFRMVDSWQAYQELDMFISNFANPEVNTISMSDTDRATQHGFDEWSFRKLPTKKK